jgi:hypothetical protein
MRWIEREREDRLSEGWREPIEGGKASKDRGRDGWMEG